MLFPKVKILGQQYLPEPQVVLALMAAFNWLVVMLPTWLLKHET